jgi:uncharacterized protein (DUF302 family)
MLSLNKKWFIGTVIVIATLFVSLTLFGQDQTKKNDSIKQTNYGFSKVVNLGYDKAIEKVTEELKKEGFGILTEIDVKETLKKKLDVDFKPYKILGACNPPFAYKALQSEEQIGLMLPCNVIVYINDNSETVVAAINPIASMQAVKNDKLAEIAATIQGKLKKVIDSL